MQQFWLAIVCLFVSYMQWNIGAQVLLLELFSRPLLMLVNVIPYYFCAWFLLEAFVEIFKANPRI
jgi:hypothetical protein